MLFFLLGPASLARAATELARVGNTVITLEDFNKKYQDNLKFFQFKVPSKKAVLDDLVKRETGIQAAKREGLDRDPEIADRMNTVLYHAYLDKKLSKEFEAIKVSDDEAKAHYLKNPEIRTSQILIGLSPNAKPDEVTRARDKVQSIYDQDVKDGKMTFAEAAQRFSEAPSAPMGGDIDYQTRDKLDPAYYEAALALRTPGRTSGIVRTALGFNIIKLTAIRAWEDADKALAKRTLFEEKRNQIFENFINRLKAQNRTVVHTELLKE